MSEEAVQDGWLDLPERIIFRVDAFITMPLPS
jgi:hypothetical protein